MCASSVEFQDGDILRLRRDLRNAEEEVFLDTQRGWTQEWHETGRTSLRTLRSFLAAFAVRAFDAKGAKKIFCRYFFPATACRHFP